MLAMSRSFLVDSLISPRSPTEPSGEMREGLIPPSSLVRASFNPSSPYFPTGAHTCKQHDVLSLYSCRACLTIPPALKAVAPTLSLASSGGFPPSPPAGSSPQLIRPVPVSLPLMGPLYGHLYNSIPQHTRLPQSSTPREKSPPIKGLFLTLKQLMN